MSDHEETHDYRLGKLESDVSDLKRHVFGRDGEMGLIHMVKFMWRMHVLWPWCTASAIVGFILKGILDYIKTGHLL